MNTKILLVLLLLVCGGAVGYFVWDSGNSATPPGTGGPATTPNGTDDIDDVPTTPQTAAQTERREAPETTDAGPTRLDANQPQSNPDQFAQGVTGRAIDGSGTPVADATVYLMRGQGQDMMQILLAQQQGVIEPPVALGKTDSMGRFKIGVQQIEPNRKYELRLLSDRHADGTKPGVTLFDSKWSDVGEVKMVRGEAVYGRVTAQGASGLPIPGAEVSVQATGNFSSVSPVPGREKGITAITDSNGNFRLENIAAGLVKISAVTTGFAKIERQNIQITQDGDNQVNFELPQGLTISGIIIDGEGEPVGNAKITGIAISSKTPLSADTRSDTDGSFELIGLTEGPFQVNTIAPGFVKNETKPVFAGTADEEIVLERQGSARIRVRSKGNRNITSFSVTLKRYFPEQESYGNVPDARMHKVNARKLDDGYYTMTGINPETYVFEVHSKGFAKTYSEPFTVALREAPPTIDVTASEGGTIAGVVLGADGQPLGGVQVFTLPNFFDENPFTTMFGGMIPFKISKKSVTTNKSGRYQFKLLAAGNYQLKFQHPQFCTQFIKDKEVLEGQKTSVSDVQLDAGCSVTGTVRVNGTAGGQVKISISSVPDPNNPGTMGFNAEIVTDNSGQFTIPKRLPPGSYQARAARQDHVSPLLAVVDFANTQQDFTVGRGQTTFQLHFSITDN